MLPGEARVDVTASTTFYVYLLASKPYGMQYIGLTDELTRWVRSKIRPLLGAKLQSGTKARAFNAEDARVRRGREGDRLPLRPSRILHDLYVKALIF